MINSFPADFLPLRTERLVLRRMMQPDRERFLAYRQDPIVARFQSWSALSPEEAEAFIAEMQVAAIAQPGEWFQLAIAHRASNQLIGDIGLHRYREDPTTVELGFTLAREEQGKGQGREALNALVKALFDTGTVTKIAGVTDARNVPSIRLMVSLGMNVVRSQETEFRGEWCIEQTFELTRFVSRTQ